MAEVRSNRTYGITSQRSNGDRAHLVECVSSPGWSIVLDVMEETIIEMEADLINTGVSDRAGILAKQQKVQAAWQIFTHLQEKVIAEVTAYNLATTPEAPPRATEEDAEILQITEPFNEYADIAPAE